MHVDGHGRLNLAVGASIGNEVCELFSGSARPGCKQVPMHWLYQSASLALAGGVLSSLGSASSRAWASSSCVPSSSGVVMVAAGFVEFFGLNHVAMRGR